MIIKIKDGIELVAKCEALTLTLYYERTEDGFKMVEEKPMDRAYGELEIFFELEGIMGGPAVSFRETGTLAGELMATKRKRAPVSMDIQLPEGVVHARDGIGDWHKIINLSTRKSSYAE